MKNFILGCLIAALAFLVYPHWHDIKCTVSEDLSECQPPPEPQEDVAKVAVAENPQKIYKWVDQEGVVHYGEKEVGKRIDDQLHPLTILQPEKTPVSSFTTTNTSRPVVRTDNRKAEKERKKLACARLAGKRDSYSMRSDQYRRYRTQYAKQCQFK